MMQKAIKQVVNGRHLTEEQAQAVMSQIMEGKACPAQIGALLAALQLKGETVDEITGFARAMRQKAAAVKSRHPLLIDTCGTGGDGAGTFNISTAAALVLAGAGAKVAKHGNRSVSSSSGSADVLEALGVKVDISPQQAGQCLDEVGICFLYAPMLHKAMKHAAEPRRAIGVRTVFNILGPLTNPAGAQNQVVGVYSPHLVEKIARVLARLGSRRAFVVHGAGGLDEVSLAGPTTVCEVKDGAVSSFTFHPEKYRFKPAAVEELAGGSPEQNAAVIKRILNGEKGAKRDAVILNAAFGLVCADAAGDIAEGIKQAEAAVDSGAALKKLQELIDFTNKILSHKAVNF